MVLNKSVTIAWIHCIPKNLKRAVHEARDHSIDLPTQRKMLGAQRNTCHKKIVFVSLVYNFDSCEPQQMKQQQQHTHN